MSVERRSSSRSIVESDSENSLELFVEGKRVEILQAHDISPFGIGLLVENRQRNGSDIRLRYCSDETEVEVFGVIAWSAAASSMHEEGVEASRIGIYLLPENAVSNVAFFNVITSL